MISVKATREGLVGQITATGWRIDGEYPFVALPSHKALGMWVKIRNPLTGKLCCAQVLDVGPFNVNDDAYVFQAITEDDLTPGPDSVRPLAESGKSVSGQGTNQAGIDLGEKVWGLLGMKDNTDVEWKFIG